MKTLPSMAAGKDVEKGLFCVIGVRVNWCNLSEADLTVTIIILNTYTSKEM